MSGRSAQVSNVTQRSLRIARGLANPVSRPYYVSAARRRLSRDAAPRQKGLRCLVCRSPEVKQRTITYAKNANLTCQVRICRRCGFVSSPKDSGGRYRDQKDLDSLPGSKRAGTDTFKGREFHMATMALDILGRDDLEVLVYGAGRSLDDVHIGRLPQVRHVAIGDIMKLRHDVDFVHAEAPASRRFSVVIASEVIEHFRDPWSDFEKLFRLVERDGIVVCGTNIYDGGRLKQDRYIFYPDHTSYYTPQALRMIAQRYGFHLDFRPTGGRSPKRKRYVILSKSRRVMDDVCDYFGSHKYAPTEAAP